MTGKGGVAVSRPVAVLAVVMLIGLAAAVGVLYSRLPAAAAPGRPALPPPEAPLTAEPVSGRFTEVPYACGLLTKAQFGALVRDPFSRRDGRGGCEWDSVDTAKKPRHGLVIRLRLLPSEARAREYVEALRADAISPSPVTELGDEAYAARGDMSALPGFARRTVVRLGNLIAEIDYRAYGATADRGGRLGRGVRQAATWTVRALEPAG
ncbi:hypothetical protein ACWDRB_40535 [Nonomuraea sp. NPDC003707]